jgi:hypothetical protein
VDAPSQYVTIAEISGEPVNGYPGTRLPHTAVVPKDEAQECLERDGGVLRTCGRRAPLLRIRFYG